MVKEENTGHVVMLQGDAGVQRAPLGLSSLFNTGTGSQCRNMQMRETQQFTKEVFSAVMSASEPYCWGCRSVNGTHTGRQGWSYSV